MDIRLFDYPLPPDRIAQKSVEPRDRAKLLLLDRQSGAHEDRHVFDLPDKLLPGDLLVFNDSRVFKARLFAATKQGTRVEILLLRPLCPSHDTDCPVSDHGSFWLALAKPGKKLRENTFIRFDDTTQAVVVKKYPDGTVCLNFQRSAADVFALTDRLGHIPTPPYVKTAVQDETLYQTLYAKQTGSVAAPTAGFHFTKNLLDRISAKNIRTAYVTLHIGIGTFRPIKTATLTEHVMHEEWFSIPQTTADLIQDTKQRHGRVIAIGTTAVRALESSRGKACTGFTSLFIIPGYTFQIVDALLTNFHLPKSTLLVLVSAFAGRTHVLDAYHHAIKTGYRFYSFGDAMLIQ